MQQVFHVQPQTDIAIKTACRLMPDDDRLRRHRTRAATSRNAVSNQLGHYTIIHMLLYLCQRGSTGVLLAVQGSATGRSSEEEKGTQTQARSSWLNHLRMLCTCEGKRHMVNCTWIYYMSYDTIFVINNHAINQSTGF